MTPAIHSEDPAHLLWRGVIEAEGAMRTSLQAFLSAPAGERVELVRTALRAPRSDRAVAIRVLPYLSRADRQALFPDLVWLASSSHGLVQHARDAVLSLPRAWVVANVATATEPLLAQSNEAGQYEEYRRLLELYHQLGDLALLQELAERALRHSDADVQEAGQDFLAKVSPNIV